MSEGVYCIIVKEHSIEMNCCGHQYSIKQCRHKYAFIQEFSLLICFHHQVNFTLDITVVLIILRQIYSHATENLLLVKL